MQKVKFIDIYGVFHFLILILFSLFITSINDELLFKTDIINVIHYILGVNLLLVFILTPLIIPVIFIKDNFKEKIISLLSYFLIVNLLFGFSYKVLFRHIFEFSSLKFLFAGSGILYLICIIITFFLPNKNEIKQRIMQFSKWFTLVVVIFLVLLTVFRHIEYIFCNPAENKKNIVMIIMDGLSTHEVPYYNPEVKIPEFDDIAKDVTLYKNIYTNFTYTSGFFDALYNGCKDNSVFSKNRISRKVNLIKFLQYSGINFKWSVKHPNALPDVSLVSSYNGLRSFYLNENFTWIPAVLGIKYHIYRIRGINNGDPKIRKILTSFLIRLPRQQKPLETHLVKEINNLRHFKKPFFLVCHTGYNAEAPIDWLTEKEVRQARLWERLVVKSNSDLIQSEIRGNDYVYKDKDAWLVEILGSQYFVDIKSGIKSINKFLKILKEKKWDKDTIVIITADHGHIFSKGKVWYGFHNEEEVTKVPLLIFDNERKGIDSRLGETIDISQTILDYFGIKEKVSADAVSLLGNKKKNYVTTLTTASYIRDEQFLNIYEFKDNDIYKYIINTKKNDNSIVESKVKGFDTIYIKKIDTNIYNLNFDYKKVLIDYGLNDIM